jgi:NIMA (never in mitosis gene a)-related kinase
MSRSKLADFEILSRLGSGSFGIVYKARRTLDDQIYVIKNVRIAELSYKEQTEAINEVQILAQLKSPYVVRYFDSFIEKDSLHIVMEFCNRGDLQNLLKKAKEKDVSGLKDSVIWNICLQVILGLHYLHKRHILHRDLKTANVFLMKDASQTNYFVKIGDLGVAKLMDTSTALANTIVGTP